VEEQMTSEQQREIDQWFEACQKAQPEGTLAFLLYVRDGKVHIGRGNVAMEMKAFPLPDLPAVSRLLAATINQVYQNGPSNGKPPQGV